MKVRSGAKPPTANSSRSHRPRSSSVRLAKSLAVAFISAARSSLAIRPTRAPPYGGFSAPVVAAVLAVEVEAGMVRLLSLIGPWSLVLSPSAALLLPSLGQPQDGPHKLGGSGQPGM